MTLVIPWRKKWCVFFLFICFKRSRPKLFFKNAILKNVESSKEIIYDGVALLGDFHNSYFVEHLKKLLSLLNYFYGSCRVCGYLIERKCFIVEKWQLHTFCKQQYQYRCSGGAKASEKQSNKELSLVSWRQKLSTAFRYFSLNCHEL